MNAAYDRFTHLAQWEPSLGDATYPGLSNRGPAVTIPTKKTEKSEDLAGDITSNVQYSTLPEHQVKPKDAIDGAEILIVEAVKDLDGNVLWWVAHGRS